MADFVAVLRKTIDGLVDNTPALREKVYDKARSTVAAKLAAINPPPPVAVADRQKQVLEDAIGEVEAGYSGQLDDPFAELENVFAKPAKVEPQPMAAKAPPPLEVRPTSSAQPAPPPPVQTRVAEAFPPLPGSRVEPKPWLGNEAEAESDLPPPDSSQLPAPFDSDDEGAEEDGGIYEEFPERRRNFMPLVAAVVVLALILGGGYAVWLNKDDFMAMLGIGGETVASNAPAIGDTAPVDPPAPTAVKSSENAGESEGTQKFTQRLNTDGTEVDTGPAGGIASIGEGTSVAAATQPSQPPIATDAPADDPAVAETPATGPGPEEPAAPGATPGTTDATTAPADAQGQVAVSQKAIFYEERTNVAEGSAEPGNVVWTLVQESPGDGQPAEPAIHGEATIPGKDVELRVTIRRNADKTLPASHIIELIFLTPEGFDGGGIDKVLRFALKDTEQDPGSQLLAIPPAKVAPGYFLVALNDSKAETETNLNLLRREQWIDVPVVYENGRRALITLEKGIPGDKVFDEVIKVWQSTTSG